MVSWITCAWTASNSAWNARPECVSETRTRRLENPRGTSDRPISEEAIVTKFRANAARAVASGAVEGLEQAVLSLDTLQDLSALSAAARSRT